MGETCGTHGGELYAYRVWLGKPTGEKPLERLWNRWKYNISRVLKKILNSVDWIYLAQDRNKCRAVVGKAMKFRFLKTA